MHFEVTDTANTLRAFGRHCSNDCSFIHSIVAKKAFQFYTLFNITNKKHKHSIFILLMHKMSNEQRAVLDKMRSGRNVVVDACAGSGKSTTILSIAKELTGKHIQQFTYNSMLRHEIKDKVKQYKLKNLDVHTFHSFAVKYYSSLAHTDTGIRVVLQNNMKPKQKIPLFDIVVLDETQDMTLLYFELIVKMSKDMCEDEHQFQLLILGDYMQGLYEFKGADIRFLTKSQQVWKDFKYLEHKEFVSCNLKTSYRVTNQMADFVNHDMLGEKRLIACREGVPVVYIRRPKNMIENIVVYTIKKLLNEGESPSDIFVLGNSVKGTNSHIRNMENVLTEAGIPCHVPMMESDIMDERVIEGKVVFSTFHTVKGRQRKYVFVVGFDQGYFYNARNLDKTQCPNTLYVACTRATHCLYLLQNESSTPLEFMKNEQYDMKQCPYIDFKGMPQNIVYKPVQEDESIVTIPTFHVTPTSLIKFISENVIEYVTPILDRAFIIEVEAKQENELDIPRIIQTSMGLFEEVSDLNGIALPAIYYDEIQNNKKDGEDVLKEMIQHSVQEMKESRHLYLKKIVQELPETCETPDDYLYLANVYVATQEKLYSKLKQIDKNEYNWITPKMKEICVQRLNENLGQEFEKKNNVEVEKQLIHYVHEIEQAKIQNVLLPYFQNTKHFKFSGRLDILSESSIWELKCTSKISQEHQLQVVIYTWLWRTLYPESPRTVRIFNLRTGEKQRLEISYDELTKIVVNLLQNKYEEIEQIDEEQFLDICDSIKKKYA